MDRTRNPIRAVAVPSEHGGWGLTIEPGLLGLLVAPSLAGACLAVAALVLFVLRTPLELALVDRRRHRRLPRTRLAERVAAAEAVLLAALVSVAAVTAHDSRWWIPAVVAAPLVAVELAYDIRSRRRRLVPEVAGAVAIAAVAAAVVIAGDGDPRLAAGLWLILAARVTTSIPHVRAQIDRLHGRDWQPGLILVSDLAAVVGAGVAVVLDGRIIVGAVVLVAVVVVRQVRRRRPVAPRRASASVRWSSASRWWRPPLSAWPRCSCRARACSLVRSRWMDNEPSDTDPGQPPTPPKGFRGSGRLLVSRPFRVIGPHVFPPLHRAINRLTGGRTLLDTPAQPMLMLTTRGAKTGRLRETPLGAVPLEEGRFLLVGSNFAREHHPAWTTNLIANPDAEIVYRGKRTRVRARLLEGAERERRWQTAVTWFPVWTRYVTVTDRQFRLFELEPLSDPAEE